jgi:hypothetical protein
MSPILDLQRRLHEAGRIRIGVTVPTKGGKTRPQRLATFRITGQDRRALERIAGLYGGAVEPWKDAPVGEQWQVITNTAEIRVAVPPERMALSQSYELWSGGGCVRRCDGERQTNDEPCLCATLEEDDQTPRCSRHTRLSLMLADLATTGLWRLDTQGFYASEELAGAFELAQMLAAATGRSLLPGWLRLEQREIRRPGEQVKRFAVPVLDLEMDTAALLGPTRAAPILPAAASADGLTPIPAEPVPSLAREIAEITEPEPSPPRRNAAAPIPPARIKPRTAHEARTEQDKPSQPQMRKLFALLSERDMADHDVRIDWANRQLDRTIVSFAELTDVEASGLIDALAQESLPVETGPASAMPVLESDEIAPARPAVASSHGAPGPAGLSERSIEYLMYLRREAAVDGEWVREKLAQIGFEDVPERVTKASIRRLSREQGDKLRMELEVALDARRKGQ